MGGRWHSAEAVREAGERRGRRFALQGIMGTAAAAPSEVLLSARGLSAATLPQAVGVPAPV